MANLLVFEYKWNLPVLYGKFNIGGFCNLFLISPKAFCCCSLQINCLPFLVKSYIGFNSICKSGQNKRKKVTMPAKLLQSLTVFQCKINQCFGHIKNVIVIANDIMVVGRQHNHRDHDQSVTTLLETARKCNNRLNYDILQYKQEVDFLERLIPSMGVSQLKAKLKQSMRYQLQLAKSKYNLSLAWYITSPSFQQIIRVCRTHNRTM